MINLAGLLPADEIALVSEQVKLRFKDPTRFTTPEALILYEQNLLPEAEILRLCKKAQNAELQTPAQMYVTREMVTSLRGTGGVPLQIDAAERKLYVGVIPEITCNCYSVGNFQTEQVQIPLHCFVALYTKFYGTPGFLYPIPARDKFTAVVKEALANGASDITLTVTASGAQAYFNCRKKKVKSRRTLTPEDADEIAQMLAVQAKSPISDTGYMPKYLSVNLDINHRGRVVINRTHYGRTITIRVLSNDVLSSSLEDLNLQPNTVEFIRKHVLSAEKGLRLFVGETMSGKNTTILAALRELTKLNQFKVVSLESPVEILIDGVEQIGVETEEEYSANANSFLRQNPDIAYFTEITNYSARDIMNMSNTGKITFSTIHANSISDVIARLQDVTSMSSDRVILTLHSCVFQELVRDDERDSVFPRNRCLLFTDALKSRLYGKSLGEIKTILAEEEGKWGHSNGTRC